MVMVEQKERKIVFTAEIIRNVELVAHKLGVLQAPSGLAADIT